MLRCIIIDDEQHAIDLLSDYAKESNRLEVVATTRNPVEGLELIHLLKPAVVFLDIHMPKLSGIDIVHALQGNQKVVFCTAYSEFASDAYEMDVVDYLLKPVRFERFLRAVNKLVSSGGEAYAVKDDYETDYMFVKSESKRKLLKINIRDIDFIEGMKNYIAIHHNGIRTMALLNMKDVEERLPGNYFIRTHKSFIVNVQRITGITDDIVHLVNIKDEVLIGAGYRDGFMRKMKGKLMERPK